MRLIDEDEHHGSQSPGVHRVVNFFAQAAPGEDSSKVRDPSLFAAHEIYLSKPHKEKTKFEELIRTGYANKDIAAKMAVAWPNCTAEVVGVYEHYFYQLPET